MKVLTPESEVASSQYSPPNPVAARPGPPAGAGGKGSAGCAAAGNSMHSLRPFRGARPSSGAAISALACASKCSFAPLGSGLSIRKRVRIPFGPSRCTHRSESGSAMVLTIIMISCALLILASTMAWSNSTAKQTDRANRYVAATAAAEAATEFALSKISKDFLNGGDALVLASITNYRTPALSSAQSPYWSNWEFSDAQGQPNRTYVDISTSSNFTVLDSTYAGLKGYVTTCTIVSDAHQPGALNDVVAGVYQQVQLCRIPIFQWAMFSSGDMEISCGKPFTVTGPVHSNQKLYVEPDASLTFLSAVTASDDILSSRHPLDDARVAPTGDVLYKVKPKSHQPALTLPIGQTNTPIAVREIIEPPPAGEDSTTPLAKSRYYNQSDLIITVTADRITATSGRYDNFNHSLTNGEITLFVSTNNAFRDEREDKLVQSIDIDIRKLRLWSATNGSIRPLLGNIDVWSVYVWDKRPFDNSSMSGVRVVNGQALPSRGLTVATGSPLYVLGDFNAPNPGSTNTSGTLPASLVGDALTVLSGSWNDIVSLTLGKPGYLLRTTLSSTTINAAILAGAVDTTKGHYSGGMENFPRFLEDWSLATFTYNGSMVKMFPSLYATGV